MRTKIIIIVLVLSAIAMQSLTLAVDKPTAEDRPAEAAEPNDLAGVRCQIWTIRQGDDRKSTCYDGTIKSINKKTATIVVSRYKLRTSTRVLGIEGELTDDWKLLGDKEVAIPMDSIDLIKFKIGK